MCSCVRLNKAGTIVLNGFCKQKFLEINFYGAKILSLHTECKQIDIYERQIVSHSSGIQ